MKEPREGEGAAARPDGGSKAGSRGQGAPRLAVFGATSAIAEAVARRYALKGASLFLVARRVETLAAIARDLEIRGAARTATRVCDLADPAAHPALLEAMDEEFGTPDIVLLAWGTLTDQARADTDPAYAARELAGNFVAPAALLLALAARLEAAGGAVIAVITSVAGDRGRQSNFVYGAAKGGLQRLLEGLRHRLAGKGVTVLDIRPGFVDTPMTGHLTKGGPLWATPDGVASDIVRAVERRRAVLYTPWFWRWIMLIVRSLPRAVLHRTRL